MTFIDKIWSLGGFLYDLASGFWGLVTGIAGLGYSVLYTVHDFLSFLPAEWQALIYAGLTISILYTIHSFVKHIQIAGFKI